MATFEYSGGEELEKALREWGQNSAKAVKKVVEAGGDAAVKQAQATSAWSDRTGSLRGSIKRSAVKHKANEAYVEVYPDGTGADGKRMAEVGFVLEYGRGGKVFTRPTKRGNRKRYIIKPMSPRPWLRPAIEEGGSAIGSAMEQAWKEGMQHG